MIKISSYRRRYRIHNVSYFIALCILRYISPAPHLANFDLKIVSKNGANFVLHCAGICKFCAAPL